MKKNEFLSIISSPLMNLDHIARYNGTNLVENESLSQHIVDTIMLGWKIIDYINYIEEDEDQKLDIASYTMRAVYHDLEESITGDVPRPLKYHDDQTHSSLEAVAIDVADKLLSEQFYSKGHFEMWQDAKLGREGYILKLVDTLSVAFKVVKEVSLLNNNYMLKVCYEVEHYLSIMSEDLVNDHHDLSDIAVEYLQGTLLHDTLCALHDILSSHKDILESLHLADLSML